ncbi:MAG: hypothetical protein KC668_03670 [Myxococcales bacterium]|nr:hypothetical protein [Myxococcales bacterium]
MTRIAILFAGAAGSLILARTAGFYQGEDPLAFGVVALMAAALFAGVVELLVHAQRLSGLTNELQKLTKEPSLEGIDNASPVLRALLQARLDRVSLGVPRASFTPYLIGLLVMLGLLGTFLGLFETLRGARLALTASTDVEALREGLSTPMSGLMRSFGTSAAGVSSSAMLGLAAVFARRAAGQLGVQLHAAASGPFARFASSHRQLVALEQLAVQGESLPAAAAALSRASEELMALRGEWMRAHAEASDAVATRLLEATESVQRTVQAGVEQSASATHRAVAPLLEQAVAGTVAAAGAHLSAIEAKVDEASESRRKTERLVTEQLSAHLESVTARLDAQVTAARASDDARRSALAEQERQADEARERHVAAVLAALAQHAERDVEAERTQREEARALEAERRELWAAVQNTLEQTLTQRGEALDAALLAAGESLVSSLRAHAEASRAEEDARAARVGERLHAVTATLEQTVRALASAEGERAQVLHTHLQTMSERLAAASERLGSEEERRAALLTEHVDGMSHEMRTAFSAAAERDAERAETLAQVAGTLRTELSAAAEVMRDRLGASADADAARAREAQAMFEELKAASIHIAEAARSQSTALQQFVAATEGRTEAMEARSEERLATLLDRIRETVDTQAERLGALEEGLRTAQAESAAMLAQQLGAHAETLSASLGQTSQLVQDAAGLVQAGGTELTAVAEMFAEAVDRQREAAREWLENLGHVERAVADAGEGAAADALGHHLARTHEIFDRQLRFQQELFEQLRHGRMNGHAANNTPPHGIETDVSA